MINSESDSDLASAEQTQNRPGHIAVVLDTLSVALLQLLAMYCVQLPNTNTNRFNHDPFLPYTNIFVRLLILVKPILAGIALS